MVEIETLWNIRLILFVNDKSNRVDQVSQGVMKMIGYRQNLQLKAETLNGIEKRAILGQPDNAQPVPIHCSPVCSNGQLLAPFIFLAASLTAFARAWGFSLLM
jgi:hypothetical protein